MINKALFEGRLARDAELRFTKNGKAFTEFTLLQNAWTPKGDQTVPCRCVLYFKSEEHADKQMDMLRQGNLVSIEGRMIVQTWEGEDGGRRERSKVIVSNFHFLARSKKNQEEHEAAGPRREQYEDADTRSLEELVSEETLDLEPSDDIL